MSAILYFDVGSPYVYLALERLERCDVGEVTLRPIDLGALFKATGRSSWGLGPERERGMAEVAGRASAYGLPPVRWPEGWPGNYLHANRACLVAEEQGALEQFARAALRAAFTRAVDLGDDASVLAIARAVGLNADHVRARILDDGEYAAYASHSPSSATTDTVSPGAGAPSTRAIAPEKIHGCRCRSDLSRIHRHLSHRSESCTDRDIDRGSERASRRTFERQQR